MLFNSFEFLIFFPVVTILYFLLPYRFRWFHLLVASCVFYMAFIPVYILILLITIVIDYIAGILIEDAQGARRKLYLLMSLVANIGVLAVFKYFNFFVDNINGVFQALHSPTVLPYLGIILPLGLSFHTFQAMSYTIEVYRGHERAERHFGIYTLYVMFYPQLVAGPIERPQNILHQFHEKHRFDYDQVTSGLRLMAWGMFKKVVVADRLAIFVNQIYDDPRHAQGLPLLVATIFFALQIYCDFSAYSEIALGAARVMGFELLINFRRPYFARSISEFWKRWHISLSTWFRDYLYISMGGNRVSVSKRYFNLFIVFLVSGFWHGANWTFVVWGALHGIYLVVGSLTQGFRQRLTAALPKRLDHILDILVTCGLVTFAWIFFRASSIADAWYIITHMSAPSHALERGADYYGLSSIKVFYHKQEWAYLLLGTATLITVEMVQRRHSFNSLVLRQPLMLRWAGYFAIVSAIIFFGAFDKVQFIYFQF
ncbi:MAG: MBOAT family O-acyltransferase [Janthinobacterium lividum]